VGLGRRYAAPMSSTLNDGEIMDNPVIKKAVKDNAKAISELILSVASYFTLYPDGKGAERFLASMSEDAIQGYIESPSFSYFVCCVGRELAGVVAVREKSHLFHLFVLPKYQKSGISRLLWQHLLANVFEPNGIALITVNSTPYAVPVYEKFGFNVVGDRVERDGISFVPMRFEAHSFNKSRHSAN
jgi:GNAT superfamily N-acetyltransferase